MEAVMESTSLNGSHLIPLIVLGSITSTLSLLGSLGIVFIARKELAHSFMNRLLFSLSLADALASISLLLSPYMVPSYMNVPGASGNHASCTAIGFVFMTGLIATSCYNGFLGVFYYLTVVRNWRERDFTRHIEMVMHSVAVLIPISINIAAAATESINPTPFYSNICIYAPIPWGCEDNNEVECVRSSPLAAMSLIRTVIPFQGFFAILGFVCTILVWWSVRQTIRRSSSYHFTGAESNDSNARRLEQVRIQATLYCLVYWNTFIWPFIGLVLASLHNTRESLAMQTQPGPYALQVLTWIFLPLQGALNFFVYTRTKAQEWRKAAPQQSWIWIYRQVLSSTELPRKASTTRSFVLQSNNPTTTKNTTAAEQNLNNPPSKADDEILGYPSVDDCDEFACENHEAE
ncbi:expressed unknown protein [Seminavis robusta]|uniref:G-protein coupled receptors family 1 profile domain-containing protein n=1 Tax=Seminavis robusta TaxID=568900 RepID=A0A9N8H8W8_9STRA|nr:expressed unknown protein [Seminavis robusta]|eukprot:Sro234_g094300.1 n/a (405) ;mRNA; r:4528-5906